MDLRETILRDLERRVEAAGLTFPEACRLAGVSLTTVNRWKKKDTWPTIRILQQFEKVLPAAPADKRAA